MDGHQDRHVGEHAHPRREGFCALIVDPEPAHPDATRHETETQLGPPITEVAGIDTERRSRLGAAPVTSLGPEKARRIE
jgi:hypothetical protein